MREIDLSGLSIRDRITIGFPREIDVGKHLRCAQWKFEPEELVLHITRGLGEIDSKNIFGYTKQLMREVRDDFVELAVLLDENDNLKKVEAIRGLAAFPEKLGEQFGFWSYEVPENAALDKVYRKTVIKKKLAGNTTHSNPVRRFRISRDEFQKLYLPPQDQT